MKKEKEQKRKEGLSRLFEGKKAQCSELFEEN